jgi:hypothetical protein
VDDVVKKTKTPTKPKKGIGMETWTEESEGVEYLIVKSGEVIHQIDLRAISSWGLLLGLTDPAEVVSKILRFKEKRTAKGEPNLWTPLYETLTAGLDEMSQSGVPAEYMEEVLTSDAPVPSTEATDAILAAQQAGRDQIDLDPDEWGDVSAALTSVLEPHTEAIAASRVEFVDALAPVYEIPPPPAFESVPEAMHLLNEKTEQENAQTVE